MSTRFLVYGQLRWGKGASLSEAKTNFTGAGGRLSAGYEIQEWPEGVEIQGVDQMGRIHYLGQGRPTETSVPARKPARR